MAVAQALSRLTRQGIIERLSKGVYYRARQTAFGKSLPSPAALGSLRLNAGRFFRLESPRLIFWLSPRKAQNAVKLPLPLSACPEN